MDARAPSAEAVAVAGGKIAATGSLNVLQSAYPAACTDETFAGKVIVPSLIDPHVHMSLSSLQYATKLSPPWEMATSESIGAGLPTRATREDTPLTPSERFNAQDACEDWDEIGIWGELPPLDQ